MITSLFGTAIINDGPPCHAELEIERQFETVYFDNATTYDPGWTHVDPAGHFHAYGKEGSTPTLRAAVRHVPCDGIHAFPVEDCDGYDVTDYTCRICSAPVEPGHVRQESAVIPLGQTWTVKVRNDPTPLPFGVQVTVRFQCDGASYFGIAAVGDWSGVFTSGGTEGVRTLAGIGELGACAARVPRTPVV